MGLATVLVELPANRRPTWPRGIARRVQDQSSRIATGAEIAVRNSKLIHECRDFAGPAATFIRIPHVDRHIDGRDSSGRVTGGPTVLLHLVPDCHGGGTGVDRFDVNQESRVRRVAYYNASVRNNCNRGIYLVIGIEGDGDEVGESGNLITLVLGADRVLVDQSRMNDCLPYIRLVGAGENVVIAEDVVIGAVGHHDAQGPATTKRAACVGDVATGDAQGNLTSRTREPTDLPCALPRRRPGPASRSQAKRPPEPKMLLAYRPSPGARTE